MIVLTVGMSHHTAPLEVRERFSLGVEQREAMLQALLRYVQRGVVLATCNRTEIYTLVKHADIGVQHLQRCMAEFGQATPEELVPYLFRYEHEAAVRHLFRVAAGLDSLILGEDQILGQVKEAMDAAQAHDALGPVLSNLFRQAIRVGKRARSDTAISRNAVSVSAAAVALARRFFGQLTARRVLVISAGEAGKLAGRSLVKSGIGSVTVTSRTWERAVELANQLGGEALPFQELERGLVDADIVISATGASDIILSAQEVRRAMAQRPERPLFMVDIAMPRDIDPATATIPNVFLRNIDDLQSVADANLQARKEEAAKVEALIHAEVAKFRSWWRTLEVLPTVAALRRRAEAVRQAELARTLPRLKGLSERDRARIDAMTNAIVKKLLHHPLTRLKEDGDGQGYIRAVQELFDLVQSPSTSSGRRKKREASPPKTVRSPSRK